MKQQKKINKWDKIIQFNITSERYKTSFNCNDKKELEVEDCRR